VAETKFGTFEDLLELMVKELRTVAIRLREIIFELDPNVCEVVRLGEKAATYGVGPRKMSEGYAYILPYKNWMNLGFYYGALLVDKTELLEGTGKNMRHIKIHSLEDTVKPEIKELLQLALQERIEVLKS
jgi:hypothetical protein